MSPLEPYLHTPRVAYFSMEIALESAIPTYAGGLGVLAGDTVQAAADLELPLVAVSLVSRGGHFRQTFDPAGRQVEQPAPWEPREHATPLAAKVALTLEEREVWVGGWLYVLQGHLGGTQPVLLLDTDLDENHPDDRQITHRLYGDDGPYRLKQEAVLGIGGVRLLQALGFRLRQYHMNEGHSALLALELLRRYAHRPEELRPGESPYDVPMVRGQCCFTTHTPVEAGHDRFSYTVVQQVLDDFIPLAVLKQLAGENALNMTRLALNLSEYVNGVAQRHAEVSRRMFPGYRVHAVTNGIHPSTWAAPPLSGLFDRYVPNWRHEPELLVRADQIPDDDLWQAHQEAKQALIEKIYTLSGRTFDPSLPIIGFARRITAYKRPYLLFSSPDRLREIVAAQPFQLVIAGKAHPRDEPAKALMREIYRLCAAVGDNFNWVYLPNYDMALALSLVSGSDLWLNTPKRPMEASGTSGMKAALNAVPNLSILDGWWAEGCIEQVTGWAIGTPDVPDMDQEDADSLYDKLAHQVLPLYRDDRTGWIRIMKGAVSKNAYYFNSLRMMRRYAAEAYIR